LTATDQEPTDAEIAATLRRIGALPHDAVPRMTQLTGGVSSDIRLVEWDAGRLCVKRALPRLRVAQLWEAPVERNGFEWAWFEAVAGICPEAVPRLVAAAPEAGLFAMEYLEPAAAEVEAECVAPPDEVWVRLVRTIRRWGKGRIELSVDLRVEGKVVGCFVGAFVGLTENGGRGRG